MFYRLKNGIFSFSTAEKAGRNYAELSTQFKHVLLLVLNIVLVLPISAQTEYPLVRTPQDVSISKTLPKNVLSADEPITATFSKEPTDEEIFSTHFLEEPIIPMKDKAGRNENADLVFALARFTQRKVRDDFSAITEFLKSYPKSRWRLSLLVNLGLMYRKTGWYSKALESWEEAWTIGKKINVQPLHDLTDRVVGELSYLNASLGRFNRLQALFKETKNRRVRGPATELLASAKDGLDLMLKRPEMPFRCGPLALNSIQRFLGKESKTYNIFFNSKSTQKGISLKQLVHISDSANMNLQAARRTSKDAQLVMPCVVHWKTDHYAALIKEENGLYLLQDPTFVNDVWVSRKALEEETSGYFLVPQGSLPKGWVPVSLGEADKVWGKGGPKSSDNNATTCHDDKCGGSGDRSVPHGMATYSFHTMLASLRIQDNPVGYSPPKGPSVDFSVVYNQREINQPAAFTYSNLGPKWTFNWLSYLTDDPNNDNGQVTLFTVSGGAFVFNNYNSSTQSYAPEEMTQNVLVRKGNGCYELRHNDGSKDIYSRPDGSTGTSRKVFLTAIVDVAGNTDSIFYDANLRVTALRDALGQVTLFSYKNPNDIYKLTKVTDPFGRSASFKYDEEGRLKSITDVIGITSSFQYDSGDFINQLTTPYGVTKFEYGETPDGDEAQPHHRFLQATDPLGQTERLEMWRIRSDISTSETIVPKATGESFLNNYLDWQNSFFWDKKAMKDAPGDISKAHVYHWLHDLDFESASRIKHSEKSPLENRIWYLYTNENSPGVVNPGMLSTPRLAAQVTGQNPDSSTRIYRFEYDSIGKLTKSTDPIGRQLTYKYDSLNKIDLLDVHQTTNNANELLTKFSNYTLHLPQKVTDASGQTTNFTYNAAGQVLTITNPKKEKTSFNYDGSGYLKNITGPVSGAKVIFAYDKYGRVDTVTDSEGYKVATDYDALDRPTIITYPDKTFEQIVYNRLDAAHVKDRLGRWSHTIYDKLRNPAVIQDALGRVNQFIWSAGTLEEIADPLKHITIFNRDIQSRVVSKIYDDNKTINYSYDTSSGRLLQVTDAKGQKTNYAYYLDNNLKSITYSNAVIPTGSVSFTYDSSYNRIKTMKDTTGTTAYSYNPVTTSAQLGAGRLLKINGPLSGEDITYAYDKLGRVSSRAINGTSSSIAYDSLGRVTSASNVLGTFGYTYVNQTNRLLSVSVPNGQSIVYNYYDNTGDQRLKEIWNQSGSATVSKFDYEYDKEGQITKWTQQAGSATSNYYDLGYDLADQLISATLKNQTTNAIVKRFAYQYDKAGNRTSEQVDNNVTSSLYNTLNQMTAQQDGGAMRFKGTSSEFDSIMVKNLTSVDSANAYVDSLTNNFEAFVKVVPGGNNIVVSATDYSGNNNNTTKTYNISIGHGVNNKLHYDNNGNTDTVSNPAVTYGWDAGDRLVKITKGTNIIEFVYDGLSRRVAEKLNGTIIKRWLWCGTELCEERNASGGTVTKRFFSQGEQINGTNYYFTRDHLGSIREMTGASADIVARYDYDPYGRRKLVAGLDTADLGFTGHYVHKASELYLAPYRAYDANLGRWLSRDPIEESGGLNLFDYVLNDPLYYRDKLGLTVGSNLGFLTDFLRGTGEDKRDYPAGTDETQEMKESPGGKALRDAFYNNGCKDVFNFPYGIFQAAWETLASPSQWSNTGLQVGGFGGATAHNRGTGVVTFAIQNTAGTQSFFYHIVPDRKWNHGPMRTINQKFHWSEKIDNCKCKENKSSASQPMNVNVNSVSSVTGEIK